METQILKDIIAVIRAEQMRRESILKSADPNAAYDQWLFRDAPFVNELCLMLLVTLNHRVETELIGLAARAADHQKEISGQRYQENVSEIRKNQPTKAWKTISDELKLGSCHEPTAMDALRQLANSYKHNPWMQPDVKLLKCLRLKTADKYAPLPESASLQEGLAAFIGLEKDATYCDIADRFVEMANDFLVDVQKRTQLSEVKWAAVSLNPDDFAR